jgi:hypothetical protein
LQRARVLLVFIGDGWATGTPSRAQAESAFSAILDSPYMAFLAQYGIRRAQIVGAIEGPSTIGSLGDDPREILKEKVRLITEADVIAALKKLIDGRPAAEKDVTYMAVVSSVAHPICGDWPSAAGWHRSFSYKGVDRAYGVVLNWSGNTPTDVWNSIHGLPEVFTHELVEACSDPDGESGYHLTGVSDSDGENGLPEICDHSDRRSVRLPGFSRNVMLSGYWSNLHGGWTIPDGLSLRAALGQQTHVAVPSVRAAVSERSMRLAVRTRTR